jgi:hypothetical protein
MSIDVQNTTKKTNDREHQPQNTAGEITTRTSCDMDILLDTSVH